MAKNDGPISNGIRDEIRASRMTPYAIAKKVRENTRDKVMLSPAQIYKFVKGDVGLSLAVLDEIAVVLDLVVRGPLVVSETPALEEVAPATDDSHPSPAQRGRRARRRERQERMAREAEVAAMRAQVADMKASLRADLDAMQAKSPFAARRAKRAAEAEAAKKATSQATPLPRSGSEEDEPETLDNYTRSPGTMERTRTIGQENAREINQAIQHIGPKIPNAGMQALALKYAEPGRRIGVIEKAKFYRFIAQMMKNNPQSATILLLDDLADRFHEVSRIVPDPENMGRIGDIVTQADLWPACEDPEKLRDNMKKLLADRGVVNGVIEPTKGPKPPGYC